MKLTVETCYENENKIFYGSWQSLIKKLEKERENSFYRNYKICYTKKEISELEINERKHNRYRIRFLKLS